MQIENGSELGLEPVERRSSPRAPVCGVQVKFINIKSLIKTPFDVVDMGFESIYIKGKETATFLTGNQFPIRLYYKNSHIDCIVVCTRMDQKSYQGVALRLLPYETEGRNLLNKILRDGFINQNK